MNKLVDLFTELVKIDSPSGKERKMAEFLKKWLVRNNFKWKQDDLGSILAWVPGSRKRFMFCAHMDTVEPGCGIEPIIKNGVLQSDGSTILGADNKAALSALLSAIKRYKDKYEKLPNIELLFTVKEETGGGCENFNFEWIKSKKGLIFDYSKPHGRIITSSPFIYNFRVKFKGKAAHASRPEEGNNSLIPAMKFIGNVPIGKFDDGETTINIGKVSSGTGINVIPEITEISGEVRSTSKSKFDKYLKKIEKLARKIGGENDVEIKFTLDGYCSGYNHSEKDIFIKKIKKIYKKLNIPTVCDRSTGVSDANPLVEAGIKVVNLSDGVENAHATTEKISVQNLIKLEKIIFTFLTNLDIFSS